MLIKTGPMFGVCSISLIYPLAILKGEESDGLTLKKLRNDLPVDWHEQERMFFNV
jgi:hypothetical protein